MNVNKVILVGRTSKDPELKTTQSGQKLVSMSLATSKKWKDKNGTENSKTEWHNLVFWGKLAEIVGQYVKKGQELYIEGRLDYREYDHKDGHKVKVTDIIVEQMQMGARAGSPNKPSEPQAPIKEELPSINLDDEQSDEV